MAPDLTYAGVDVSETTVGEASENNRALIHEGRVKLRPATVDHLPFPNGSFDRALAVNTIYFWPDQLTGLTEIRRVLRDDGFLVLASMTPEISAQSPTARPDYGFCVPDRNALELLPQQAGFKRVTCDIYQEGGQASGRHNFPSGLSSLVIAPCVMRTGISSMPNTSSELTTRVTRAAVPRRNDHVPTEGRFVIVSRQRPSGAESRKARIAGYWKADHRRLAGYMIEEPGSYEHAKC